MNCVKDIKKKYSKNKFIEINEVINNIDLFEKYSLKKENNKLSKDQLFSKIPDFDLVSKILLVLTNKELNDNFYFEFCRKNLQNKNIVDKINIFIHELKKYYLKCKHKKYLENLNEKKIITILRQILRYYDFSINAIEKYENRQKYLLYIIEKKKNLNLIIKKINSLINFD
jgi:hypothetical protein